MEWPQWPQHNISCAKAALHKEKKNQESIGIPSSYDPKIPEGTSQETDLPVVPGRLEPLRGRDGDGVLVQKAGKIVVARTDLGAGSGSSSGERSFQVGNHGI